MSQIAANGFAVDMECHRRITISMVDLSAGTRSSCGVDPVIRQTNRRGNFKVTPLPRGKRRVRPLIFNLRFREETFQKPTRQGAPAGFLNVVCDTDWLSSEG